MTLVLVSREALEQLLREMVDLREAYAIEGAALKHNEVMYLHPEDEVVTLAVEAGLVIPGQLLPGTVPPAPPQHRWVGHPNTGKILGGVYRVEGDPRLRCIEDGKVVYTSMEQAEQAAKRISQREQMKAYRGPSCGHYHVSRDKRRRGATVARGFMEDE